MSTIKRLERLTGDVKTERKEPFKKGVIGDLRRRIEAVMDRRHVTSQKPFLLHGKPLSLETLIRGEEVENDQGKFFVAHDFIPGSYHHGIRHLRMISNINMQALSLLANQPELNDLHYTDALFLDTETTGLSGGTGTLPFLIGMGWFEGEAFIIRQIFVRDFTEERASLTFFLEVAKTKRFLVTFNGKAFDVGLIAARLIMNRLHDSLSCLPHLDLLHPSRRLLGHRTDNSRLGTLEGVILGIRREGDIPGSEIPRRYFDWLKSRDARFVADVFEHNRLDVLSMVSLTMHLAEMLNDQRIIDCPEPQDLMAASKLLIDRGRIPDARCLLESLIDSDNATVARESRKTLSLIYKRAGLWDKAIDIWELMIADEPGNVFAVEELAKWYEHRKRDFKKAQNLVHRALSFSRHMSDAERESLHHRLNRIQLRIDF